MAPVSPLSTQVSMRNMEVVDDVCRSAVGCGGIDLAAVVVLALFGLLALLVLAAIVHVTEATTIVEEERARLRDERDAFDAFAKRVATMDPIDRTAVVPATGGMVTASAPSDRMDGVRTAYRDTVMAVDHYDVDYGEPLGENVAAELGDDIAYAVTGDAQFTPQVKGALVTASREASQRRSSFLATLASEAESLAEAADTIDAIDDERGAVAAAPVNQRSWEALVSDWDRMGELAHRCRQSVQERQERSRRVATRRTTDGPDLHEYLYGGMSVSHPVLADLSALCDRIESERSHILREITRRV